MGMCLDGIAASEQPDSSAEVLNVKGCDISDLQQGRGTLNWEHLGDKDPGHSANDHIGRITYAKKIFARSDCENARQREYWDFVQVPFIYIKAELFNEEGHPGAVAAAAMIRHYRKKGLPILIRYSIEGTTLEQNGPALATTIARRVAATIKPANKSAISGVISDGDDDPKKASESTPVEDPLAFLIGDRTKKAEHPDQRVLGRGPELDVDPEVTPLAESVGELMGKLAEVKKTITAGQYNAAPGSLVGGAALQREDISPLQNVTFRNKAKAALRDYDPDSHGEFRKYIKHQLPEASDEFLDRFAEAVGDWKVTRQQILAKAEDDEVMEPGGRVTRSGGGMSVGSKAFQVKQAKYHKKLKDIKAEAGSTLPGMGDTAPAIPPAEEPGFKVRTSRRFTQGDAMFDPARGALLTADGVFPVYTPRLDDRGYGEILNDPDINRVHDEAIKNWMMVHRMLRSGQTPPEVVALSALFSAMSPNTAVPIQELAYGHLQDQMGAPTGQGGFEGHDPTKELSRKEYARWAKEFHAISKGQHLPAWERDHFARKDSGIWTKEGTRSKIGLGAQKFAGAKNYHEIHKVLTDLVKKHGTDARTIAAALNDMKARAGTKSQGEDPEVKGFAPKTVRYMLGMMGAGNVVVPDTHFVRHTFGLHNADPRSDVLKKYLWNEHNEHLLGELDKYYFARHPAVAHTLAKIKRDYGEDLGEQGLFPSFWLHWLTINPHEKRRGWFQRGQAKNAETDHAVFWNAVKRVMDKYNIPHSGTLLRKSEAFGDGGSMATKIAHATKELETQFGFTPATLALYAVMMPALLSHRERPELKKTEDLTARLRALVKADPEQMKPIPFRGRAVIPGELEMVAGPQAGNKYRLMELGDANKNHVLMTESGGLVQMKGGHPAYRINSKPVAYGAGYQLVDAEKHGIPGLAQHPDQVAMLHGMDLNADAIPRPKGQPRGKSERVAGNEAGWRRSHAGHVSYVKPAYAMNDLLRPSEHHGFSTAHREAAFWHLAKDFWGLGKHVPMAAAFSHPMSGEPYSASKQIEGAEHYEHSNPEHRAALANLEHTGQLDKLAIMEMILHSADDRHEGNFMVTPLRAPYLHLPDNGLSMWPEADEVPSVPAYYGYPGFEEKPLHPDAAAWVLKKNPEKLGKMMEELGVPRAQRLEAVRRLQAVQARVKRGHATKGSAYFAPFMSDQGPGHASTSDLAALANPSEDEREPTGDELGRMT